MQILKLHEHDIKYNKQFKDVHEAMCFLLPKDNHETEQNDIIE
jgi:hypothetical protein